MKKSEEKGTSLILGRVGLKIMQTTQYISIEQLLDVVRAAYDQGDVVVKETYSACDCSTREFPDAASLIRDMSYEPGQKDSFFCYAIYYPEAGGYVFEKRIDLEPRSCKGHTFRFSQNGWGLIHLQCEFRGFPKIECGIAVNSVTRAHNWSDTYTEFRAPALWDWQIIKKKAGRLVRLLRKLGKEPVKKSG